MAAVVALLIVASPHLLERLLALGTQTSAVSLAAPTAQAPWQNNASPPSDWVPAFQLPVATSHLGYSGPQGEAVGLHITYYRQQDYERKLVSSQNMLVVHDDKQWAQVSGGSATTQLAGHLGGQCGAALLQQAANQRRRRALDDLGNTAFRAAFAVVAHHTRLDAVFVQHRAHFVGWEVDVGLAVIAGHEAVAVAVTRDGAFDFGQQMVLIFFVHVF